MHALTERTPGQLETRNKIDLLEELMHEGIDSGAMVETLHDGATPEGQDQCDHFFGDGVYARGLLIPAGTAVVGKIHKQARICVIAQGDCTFCDEFQTRHVEAPWAGEFKGGTKTAVFAHSDTYWVACVGTELNDPQRILEELSAISYDEYNAFANAKQERLT